MKTLVVLEVSQKQNYIFRTNKLKENIGASMIIREVTEDLPDQFLGGTGGSVVFKGGGKSVFEFDSVGMATEFIKGITLHVLQQYPGAELFAASHDYDPDNDSLMDSVNSLYGKLENKKQARRSSFELYGLGMEQRSADSQLPAAGRDESGRLISAECMAKIKKAAGQEEFFKDVLPDAVGYRFANGFDEMGGTKNVKNMIAVIVIDGNKMGDKITRFTSNFNKAAKKKTPKERNAMYRKEFGVLSKDLDDKYHKAVKNAAGTIAQQLHDELAAGRLSPNYRKDGKLILPMRPLILSGDDICIVCDARIGIQLATEILHNIDKQTVKVKGDNMPLHACAGVAMVRTSYPFFRAHELAEELCNNAKAMLPLNADDDSALDFTIIQGEIAGSLSEIREEHYRGGELTAKPYYVGRIDKQGHISDNRPNSLPQFENRLNLLRSKISRGTLKEYRVALAKGKQSADEYVRHMRMADDLGAESSYVKIDGKERCIDMDVIEMLDMYPDQKEN